MKIKLTLEYATFPVWIYGEDGHQKMIYNKEKKIFDWYLPKPLDKDKNLIKKLWKLQNLFDKQFVNNEKEFFYKGFETEEERWKFINLAEEVREEVLEKLYKNYDIGKEYEIETKFFDRDIEESKVEKLYPENQEEESESMFKMLKDYFKKWDD